MVVDMVKDALYSMVRTVFGSLRVSAQEGNASTRRSSATTVKSTLSAAKPKSDSVLPTQSSAASTQGAIANGTAYPETDASHAGSDDAAQSPETEFGVACAQNILSFLIRLISVRPSLPALQVGTSSRDVIKYFKTSSIFGIVQPT